MATNPHPTPDAHGAKDQAIILASLGACSTWTVEDVKVAWKGWSELARDAYREHREWALEAELSREDAARFGAAAAVALTAGRFREWSRSEWIPAQKGT